MLTSIPRTAPAASPSLAAKWVYDFAEGSRDMRELLGGKGANVAEMTRVLGEDLVPPGFTITTEACVAYFRSGREPDGLWYEVTAALERLQRCAGRRFGDEGIHCWCPYVPVPASRCRGCSTRSSTSGLNDRSCSDWLP